MRATFLALVLLVLTQAANARHYHYRHWHRGYSSETRHSSGQAKKLPVPDPGPNEAASQPGQRPETRILAQPFPPPDWRLQPVTADQHGRRYLAPDGAASLTFDANPASSDSASKHLKAVAFVDGEQVLTLVGTQSELLVTGTKDHRSFMRKTRLACGGRQWHQVTFEFPIGAQRDYAQLGDQAMHALDLADNDGCDAPIARNEPAGADVKPQKAPRTDEANSAARGVPQDAQPSEE